MTQGKLEETSFDGYPDASFEDKTQEVPTRVDVHCRFEQHVTMVHVSFQR